MEDQVNSREQTILGAVRLWHSGSLAEAKESLSKVLNRFPRDVQARALLRSIVQSQPHLSGDALVSRFSEVYATHSQFLLQNAAIGWMYVAYLESRFLDSSLKPPPKQYVKKNELSNITTNDHDLSPEEILDQLLREPDIQVKWRKILSVVDSKSPALVTDSFSGQGRVAVRNSIVEFLSAPKLNFLIIGGGIVGLAIANSLKFSFGHQINILVIENRVSASHIKKNYNRHWLVHIDNELVEGLFDPQVVTLLKDIGNGKHIGGALAVFETILLLSCKNLGVKFYFEDEHDLSILDKTNVSLVFDATGGRLDLESIPNSRVKKSQGNTINEISLPAISSFGKVSEAYGITDFSDKEARKLVLNPIGNFCVPHLAGEPFRMAMIKVISIPIVLYEGLINHVKQVNSDSIFHIAPGNFNREINEILLTISLTRPAFEAFSIEVSRKLSFSDFIEKGIHKLDSLDKRITDIFEFLLESGVELESVSIDPPFLYQPYFRDISVTSMYLYDIPVIPVGDSVFNGHSKAGNGLATHLQAVARINDAILTLV